MDILKRTLAPITENAWNEINNRAKTILHANLSARKFVDVSGPNGWDFASVPAGRLETSANQKTGNVRYGVHIVQPIVETRSSFSLDIWELDNIVRGAKDVDFSPLDKAVKEAALFEEAAVYNGLKKAGIKGLTESVQYPEIPIGDSIKAVMEAVSKGITTLLNASVEGPYVLVVNPQLWRSLAELVEGYPISKHIEKLLGGEVVYSPAIDSAYLVSTRGGDLELTLGGEFSIGYESHSTEKVNLFIAESFTFRIHDPSVYVKFKATK